MKGKELTLLPVVLDLFDGGGTTPGGGAAAAGNGAAGPPGGGIAPNGRIAPGGRIVPNGRIAPEERQPGPPNRPMEDRQQRAAEPLGAVPPPTPEMLLAQRQRMEQQEADARRLELARPNRQLQSWSDQAAQVTALYPGFNLGREAQNRDFLSMLRAGVPMRQAFEVVHMDEIKAAAAAAQAQVTEKAVTANIKAKGARPPENGAGASSGFTVKDDVSRLTPKDRAEMARRAARGEVITF